MHPTFLNYISNRRVASVVKYKKGTYTHELQSSSQHRALCRGRSSGLPPTKPGDPTSPYLHLHRKNESNILQHKLVQMMQRHDVVKQRNGDM